MKKFFRFSDAVLLFLLTLFNSVPFIVIAKLQGCPPDFLHLCFVIFRSFLYSAICVLIFALFREWLNADQQDEKAQPQKEEEEYQDYLARCCPACGGLLEPGEVCECLAFTEKERENQLQKEEKE